MHQVLDRNTWIRPQICFDATYSISIIHAFRTNAHSNSPSFSLAVAAIVVALAVSCYCYCQFLMTKFWLFDIIHCIIPWFHRYLKPCGVLNFTYDRSCRHSWHNFSEKWNISIVEKVSLKFCITALKRNVIDLRFCEC